VTLALFALIVVSVSLNALAQVALRKAMTFRALPALSEPIALGTSLVANPWLWAGMACYAASIGLWLVVLSRTQVSVAYPMLSMGYVLAAVLGVLFLSETVGPARAGGIALICLGVLVVGKTA
jgi:multidrug transporter EmrE-like cation transporter